jgi:hypothetical protein
LADTTGRHHSRKAAAARCRVAFLHHHLSLFLLLLLHVRRRALLAWGVDPVEDPVVGNPNRPSQQAGRRALMNRTQTTNGRTLDS